MKNASTKHRRGSNIPRIHFPPPDPALKLDLRPGKIVTINGITATIEEAPHGLLEISNADFIKQLRHLGFTPCCDNTSERLERIVKTIVLPEFQQLFLDNVWGR